MVHPANFSLAPATNVNFSMNTAAPISLLRSSPDPVGTLTVSRLAHPASLIAQPFKPSDGHSPSPASGRSVAKTDGGKGRGEGDRPCRARRARMNRQSAIGNRQFGSCFNAFIVLTALALVFLASPSFAQTISPANLPLYFEANQNQTEFLSSGNGYQFTISASGVQMALRESGARAATAQMRFPGANPAARIHGGAEMSGKINYLIGNDPSKWQTGLPTFGDVQVTELYPGINMVFHGNQRQLEYDFAVAPDADPNAIKMQFDDVDKISVTSQGDLVLKIGNHEIRQLKPEIYQTVSGQRKTIAGGYKILDSRTVAFEIAQYDHSQPLVIDPILGFSTFFGGNVSVKGFALAFGPTNSICIAGETFSTHFSTVGAVQTNFAGGNNNGDAFVAKIDQTGTNLIYLTYLGGSDEDAAFGLAVDTNNGNAFVTGYTDSPNFPTTNALFPKIPGKPNPLFGNIYPASAFVAELGGYGTNLIYSTYLGGTNQNVATSIAVDSSDNAYVVGYTYSGDFPVINAFQPHLACSNNIYLNANGFVSEIAANGTSLLYSTFLGGTNFDVAEGVALDSSNDVLVTGYTGSFNFPTQNTPTNDPRARYLSGITNQTPGFNTYDAFVTKFPPLSTQPSAKSNLIFSMFLGGTNNDSAYGIAADASNNVYVTGWTASTNFPIIGPLPGLSSFLATNGNPGPVATNVFLTKIASDGSAILNSTIFGGRATDIGYKVAVDPGGDAFVVGWESSTNFPTANSFGSLRATNSSTTGAFDAFVTGISADWSNALYSVCIGGNRDAFGYGIVLDTSSTNVFVTGSTDSTNYPTFNTGRFSFNGTNVINGTNYIDGTRFTGTNDAFLTEITFAPSPVINLSAIEPTNNQTVGLFATVNFGVTATGAVGQILYQWKKNGTNLVNGGRISGANSATLTITNAQPVDSNTNYALAVSYPGTIISPDATNLDSLTFSNIVLDVLNFPYVITFPPTNEVVYVGTNVSFSVTASGGPNLQYLWVLNHQTFLTNEDFLTNNPNISGATNSTLTITDARTNDTANYSVTVYEYSNSVIFQTNIAGVDLTVVEPLSIITAPTNQTVSPGSTVRFSVVATGFPLSYQWQTSGTNIINGTNISGATTSTLTLTNVQTSNGGTYTVTVTNDYDFESTNLSAVLTVDPPNPYSITSVATVTNSFGTGLVLRGTGGTTNGPYYVLASTNLLTPPSQWTFIATNRFGANGQFSFTNPVSTNGSQFFMLKQP